MPRFGGFPDRPLDLDALFESTASTSGSETVRSSLPPGPEGEAALGELLVAIQERAGDLPAMIEELRGLMAGRSLTQLINAVVVSAMMGMFTGRQSLADGDRSGDWAAKVGYLVGVALSVDPTGNADTPVRVMQRVSQLISDIFDADRIRMVTESIENSDTGDGDRELLLQQLQLEDQSDRMPGYAVHLEEVDAELFGKHRNYYVNGFGFDPADVMRVTRTHIRSVNQSLSAAMGGATNALNVGLPNPAAGRAMKNAFDAIPVWKPADVAASTGVPPERVVAMLDFFSTEFGCQPEFRAPGDTNRARTHPRIKLGDGTYLVPDPWSLSAVLHRRSTSSTARTRMSAWSLVHCRRCSARTSTRRSTTISPPVITARSIPSSAPSGRWSSRRRRSH